MASANRKAEVAQARVELARIDEKIAKAKADLNKVPIAQKAKRAEQEAKIAQLKAERATVNRVIR